MNYARRIILLFQCSVVFMLLLFSHSSRSDIATFLFAAAAISPSDKIRVKGSERPSTVPHGGSATSAIRIEDHNRTSPTLSTKLANPEIVLTTQYDIQPKLLSPSEGMEVASTLGGPLKVLFLSADTGGGHRASAESLANQFLRYFPGTTYELMDVWTPTNVYPYRTLVPAYQHLSAHPNHWRILYHASNRRLYAIATDIHSHIFCYKTIKKQIEAFDPDVVISVHPTMNNVPLKATRKIAAKKNKYIPFFTVVTDYGSGHCTWFQRGVDKIYIASDPIRRLARRRGWVPNDKLVMSGLPIRHGFAIQAEKMGDRYSGKGKKYREGMKQNLELDPQKPMILLMGGGEGVGSLSSITESLFLELRNQGIDATICVVCGRNEKLRNELNSKDWMQIYKQKSQRRKGRNRVKQFFLRGRGRRSKRIQRSLDRAAKRSEVGTEPGRQPGKIDVIGLGFVTNMDEFMVAADILVTKAGPGTIAEATAVGIPVMITSFLPGQEAGNVNLVLDGGFGDFCTDPTKIALELACWLKDPDLMEEMSRRSALMGHPHAASVIVQDIGKITHEWLFRNKWSTFM